MVLFSELYKKQFELYPKLIEDLNQIINKAKKSKKSVSDIKTSIRKLRDEHVKYSIFYPESFVKRLWGYKVEPLDYSRIKKDFKDMIVLIRMESGSDKLQKKAMDDLFGNDF
jgi:uncharacterized protein Yka (UPF0111/DUF47 family)